MLFTFIRSCRKVKRLKTRMRCRHRSGGHTDNKFNLDAHRAVENRGAASDEAQKSNHEPFKSLRSHYPKQQRYVGFKNGWVSTPGVTTWSTRVGKATIAAAAAATATPGFAIFVR